MTWPIVSISPIILAYLAERAQEEFFAYLTLYCPSQVAAWHQLPDEYKNAWKACAATVLAESLNVCEHGIKAKDRR